MKLFAVRQKSTKYFIPEPMGRRGRGGSYSEPEKDCDPRLFRNRLAARSFIGMWVKGVFKSESLYPHEDDPELKVVPQPHRKKEDMEIVEFDCTEVEAHANDN